MPQQYKSIFEDPRFKLSSPEQKKEILRDIYGDMSPIEPPEVGLRKAEVKPVERTWQETLRDLPITVPNYWRPSNEIEKGMELKLGLPSVTESLPQVLGPIVGGFGSMAGPGGAVAGYAGGTSLGMGLRGMLQHASPELFGEPKGVTEALVEDIPGHLMNAVPGLGKLAVSGPARERVKESLIKTFFKNRLSPEAKAALANDMKMAAAKKIEPMPVSMGDVTGDPAMQNIYAKKEIEDLTKQQHDYLMREGGDIAESFSPQEVTREMRGREGARLTRDFAQDRLHEEARIRGEIELAGAGNTRYFDYDPKTQSMVEISKAEFNPKKNITQQKVTAPVTLTKSSQYAEGMIKELDDLTESVRSRDIPVTGEIAKIRNYLQGFKKPPKAGGVPNIKPFAEIEEAKEALDTLLEKAKPLERKTVALSSLKESLDKDIENSVKRWGAGSLGKYRALQASKAERRGLFASDVRKSLKESEEYPSSFFKEATSSSEAAERYAVTSKVYDPIKKEVLKNDNPLAREYVENILTKHGEKSYFRGKSAWKEFDDDLKQAIPQKFINAETRSNLKYFFEKASIPQRTSEIGSYALEMHKGNIVLRMGRAAAQYISMKQFAKGVLANPKMARYAAELIHAPVESNRSKLLTKAFRTAMQLPEVE